MYKVFFNDRTVFINSKTALENVSFSLIEEVLTEAQTHEIALRFLQEETIKSLLIWNSSVELLKEWFFKQFRIIEAAGGVVLNENKQLLCIHRLGKWDLPKGKVEKKEQIPHAAVREVEEECGIHAPEIVEEFEVTYHLYQNKYDANRWVLKPTYWFLMKYCGNELLTPQTEESIEDVRWVAVENLDSIVKNTYASLLPVFEKAIKVVK